MVLQFDGIWNYRQPTISRVFRTNNHRQRVVNDAGPTFAAPPQRLKLKAKPIVPSQTACRRTRPSDRMRSGAKNKIVCYGIVC